MLQITLLTTGRLYRTDSAPGWPVWAGSTECTNLRGGGGGAFRRRAWVHSEMGLNLPAGSCSRAGTCFHFLQADHRAPLHEHLLSKKDPNPSRTEAVHGTFRHLLFLWGFSHFLPIAQGWEPAPIAFLCHQHSPHPGAGTGSSRWHFHGGTPGAAGSPGACWNKRKHFDHLLALVSEQFPSLESKTSWVTLSSAEVLLPPDPPHQTSPFLLLEALQSHQGCKSMAI